MGRETVPKGVAMNGLAHSRRSPGCGHGTLDRRRVDVMPSQPPRARAVRKLARREDELPAEFLCRPWILPFESVRQLHARHAAGYVALMQPPSPFDLAFEIVAHRTR